MQHNTGSYNGPTAQTSRMSESKRIWMTITWDSLAYVTNFDELNLQCLNLLWGPQSCLHKMDYYTGGWMEREVHVYSVNILGSSFKRMEYGVCVCVCVCVCVAVPNVHICESVHSLLCM